MDFKLVKITNVEIAMEEGGFPINVYKDRVEFPASNNDPAEIYNFSAEGSLFSDKVITDDEKNNGLISRKYKFFRLADGSIVYESESKWDVYDDIEVVETVLTKISETEFTINSFSEFNGIKDFSDKVLCTKNEMLLGNLNLNKLKLFL